MKETRFIEQKKDRWQELEDALSSGNKDPDVLSDLFIQVTDDLSYARTFYGNRVVRVYLNQLTQRLFRSFFKNTVDHRKRLISFFGSELPAAIYHSRRSMYAAVIIFFVSVLIGVLSANQDAEFVKSILGDSYVSMTEANIKAGDPMAVYKNEDVLNMFLRIARNNMLVAFRAFIFGLLFSLGTIGILVFNGIMLGAFQYFFISRGLGIESALAIWMHGTMEISAIVISGAAGLVMGSGLLFPGTFTRLQSLRMSARTGIKIMAAVAPMIMVAALIEALLTRYTELNDGIRATFILVQAGFVIMYFFWLPFRKGKLSQTIRLDEDKLPQSKPIGDEMKNLPLGGDVFSLTFRLYFHSLPALLKRLSIPAIAVSTAFIFMMSDSARESVIFSGPFFFVKLSPILNFDQSRISWLIACLALSLIIFTCGRFWRRGKEFFPPWTMPFQLSSSGLLGRYFITFFLCLIAMLPLLIPSLPGVWLFLLLLPVTLFLVSAFQLIQGSFITALKQAFRIFTNAPTIVAFTLFSLLLPSLMMLVLCDFILPLINLEVLSWNFDFSSQTYKWILLVLNVLTSVFGLLLAASLCSFGMAMAYYSAVERVDAPGLKMKLKDLNLYSE